MYVVTFVAVAVRQGGQSPVKKPVPATERGDRVGTLVVLCTARVRIIEAHTEQLLWRAEGAPLPGAAVQGPREDQVPSGPSENYITDKN